MKKGFWLRTMGQMRLGAVVSGVGFLLYLAASALAWDTAAGILAIAFGLLAVYVFCSMLSLSGDSSKPVTYSLLWGQGALTILLVACAVLTVKLWLGY
ncbi:hypothetical protein [Oscillibacter sp.]|uniref:hypothetical protein n=1 Tax=Oscillibacter sp. TaxID=1945593 RepID=UPI00261EE6A3|nr:hypothetical protein [Oscillibacter sp.]MDD3346858.1 hypothetical protein [Oscillibacter sp.]